MIVSTVAATRYDCHPEPELLITTGMKSGVEGLAIGAGHILGKLIIRYITDK